MVCRGAGVGLSPGDSFGVEFMLPHKVGQARSHQTSKATFIVLGVCVFMAQRLAGIISLKNMREDQTALASVTSVVYMSKEGTLLSEASPVSSLRWDL